MPDFSVLPSPYVVERVTQEKSRGTAAPRFPGRRTALVRSPLANTKQRVFNLRPPEMLAELLSASTPFQLRPDLLRGAEIDSLYSRLAELSADAIGDKYELLMARLRKLQREEAGQMISELVEALPLNLDETQSAIDMAGETIAKYEDSSKADSAPNDPD